MGLVLNKMKRRNEELKYLKKALFFVNSFLTFGEILLTFRT